jgi:hypothetical protein
MSAMRSVLMLLMLKQVLGRRKDASLLVESENPAKMP